MLLQTLKKITGAVGGVVWIFGGRRGWGGGCVGGDRGQSQAKGWYMNNFTFCFFPHPPVFTIPPPPPGHPLPGPLLHQQVV